MSHAFTPIALAAALLVFGDIPPQSARAYETAIERGHSHDGDGARGTVVDAGSDARVDSERGSFARCVGAHRVTCVVDGDTIWFRGEKIRVADINAPELSHPACRSEADLAVAATERLTDLLNAGAFALEPWPARRIDRYGRSLYVITRAGRSLGMTLVAEGLAERWKGYRGNWCQGAPLAA